MRRRLKSTKNGAYKKGRHDGGPVLYHCVMTLFLDADCLDLLLSVALGLEGSRTNLDPGGLGGSCFNDLALLGRLFLNDVVVRARR
jgi:hypothetical protein